MEFPVTLLLAIAAIVAVASLVAWFTGSAILTGIATLVVLGVLLFGGFDALQNAVRGYLPPPPVAQSPNQPVYSTPAPAAPQPGAPARPGATPAPSPAPTTTAARPAPTPAPAPPAAGCLPTAQAVQMIRAATSVGNLVHRLNEVFDQTGGTIGSQWNTGGFDLTDPGPGGAALVWTDTLSQSWTVMTAGQTVDRNVFPVKTQGGWGTYVIFTSVKVPTPGRAVRLCEKVELHQLRK